MQHIWRKFEKRTCLGKKTCNLVFTPRWSLAHSQWVTRRDLRVARHHGDYQNLLLFPLSRASLIAYLYKTQEIKINQESQKLRVVIKFSLNDSHHIHLLQTVNNVRIFLCVFFYDFVFDLWRTFHHRFFADIQFFCNILLNT